MIIGLIFMGLGLLVGFILKRKFQKYSEIPSQRGLSGKEIAEMMLRDNGIGIYSTGGETAGRRGVTAAGWGRAVAVAMGGAVECAIGHRGGRAWPAHARHGGALGGCPCDLRGRAGTAHLGASGRRYSGARRTGCGACCHSV